MIRFVLNLDCRASITAEHFKILKWLPFQKRVEQIMLCHVFKVKNNLAPEYLCESFVAQSNVHFHSTRLSEKGGYSIPKVKGGGSKSFTFLGSKLWNALPSEITKLKNYQSFKIAVKQTLLNNI